MGNRRKRSSVILDAGYVSIQPVARSASSIFFGLHGRKLVCVISTVLILSFISFINLSCLIWIMYQLDWSPFHRSNGSKLFYYDRSNQYLQYHHQGIFEDVIYTTRIQSSHSSELHSSKQIDIYGHQNSILLEKDQITINTEYFYWNNRTSLNFNDLQHFQYDPRKRTRLHLQRVHSQQIHEKSLQIMANDKLIVTDGNRVFFSSHNLSLATNRHNRQSVLRFNSPTAQKKSVSRRQKTDNSNLDFRSESIFLDLPRLPLLENARRHEFNIYRLCICNTTFLLLRSFAHQPCPLC